MIKANRECIKYTNDGRLLQRAQTFIIVNPPFQSDYPFGESAIRARQGNMPRVGFSIDRIFVFESSSLLD